MIIDRWSKIPRALQFLIFDPPYPSGHQIAGQTQPWSESFTRVYEIVRNKRSKNNTKLNLTLECSPRKWYESRSRIILLNLSIKYTFLLSKNVDERKVLVILLAPSMKKLEYYSGNKWEHLAWASLVASAWLSKRSLWLLFTMCPLQLVLWFTWLWGTDSKSVSYW